jgi:hypothetical protein
LVFAYYANLNRKQKAIYRESDAFDAIELEEIDSLWPLTDDLEEALEKEDRRRVEGSARELVNAMLADLGLSAIRVKVLSARPSDSWGELQGLYEPEEGRRRACITVWMRTAKQKRVVAFRTFLRTLLHEICHHLDYELLELEDSFHTQGFFQRESSLFHQLMD